MTAYAAFLRAVNVGGHTPVKMDQLIEKLKSAGLSEVSSFRQSGNLTFESAGNDPASIKKIVSEQLGQITGAKQEVFLISIEKLRKAVGTDPFADLVEGERGFAIFMPGHPEQLPSFPMMLRPGITLIGVIDNIALCTVAKDIGSGPVNDLVGRLFMVKTTTRNWSTVSAMVNKFSSE
jgi:uncharacterized protein (DUF1697 family)